MRSHYCGEVNETLEGQSVSIVGWMHRRRDHGGVIFIDLRDREGLVQVVCNPEDAECFAHAERVRSEYVLKIEGIVMLICVAVRLRSLLRNLKFSMHQKHLLSR